MAGSGRTTLLGWVHGPENLPNKRERAGSGTTPATPKAELRYEHKYEHVCTYNR
jgi:hypothetical protein